MLVVADVDVVSSEGDGRGRSSVRDECVVNILHRLSKPGVPCHSLPACF